MTQTPPQRPQPPEIQRDARFRDVNDPAYATWVYLDNWEDERRKLNNPTEQAAIQLRVNENRKLIDAQTNP